MINRNTVLNRATVSNDINEYLMTIYNLPVQIEAKKVVELGCGESTFALLAAVNKTGGELYSFDFDVKGAINRYSSTDFEQIKDEIRFHPIEGDVHFTGKLWNEPIDFLFHDLSHFYAETKIEIDFWLPFVRSGGLIFAHDTAHESGDGMGCRKAYNEFMESEEGKKYRIIHLLDTKLLGGSVLIKL